MGQHLVTAIDDLIEKLSRRLDADELLHGWSEPSQQAMLKSFQDLRVRLEAGERVPYLSIVRGLDHWGISGGELFQKAAQVDHELREQPK
jgi:hypothetical protein